MDIVVQWSSNFVDSQQCRLKLISGPGRARSTGALGTGESKSKTRKSGKVQLIRALGCPMNKPELTHRTSLNAMSHVHFWCNILDQFFVLSEGEGLP
ncbi:hypothetical protein TNCV_2390811 [Trichonephila clavipes]|nr:hypothetical protein TNCV_2390811 [Trichonephila clavipes]